MRSCPPATGPLLGSLEVPGDKSVTHRAILFAMLGRAPVRICRWLRAEDTGRSLEAVRALGAEVSDDGDELVIGPGRFPEPGSAGESAPTVSIDCGNSGTTTRLLLGLLAGRNVRARLDGDESLRTRPMARVVEPLRAMGASITYLGEDGRLPLEIEGRDLRGRPHAMTVASAQVKSALLLAGLTAEGPTRVTGGGASRDHTERMLRAMGADIEGEGDDLTLAPGAALTGLDVTVPGDPSSAAFPLVAALTVPDSAVTAAGVLLNPTRTGWLDVARRMGARIDVAVTGEAAGEPVGSITATCGPLRACDIGGDALPSFIDEVPILAVLASRVDGTTRIRDAEDLRTKESDRIAAVAAGLLALGVEVTEHPAGMDIEGMPWGYGIEDAARVVTFGDHRIAMAFAIAGLVSPLGVAIDDDACVAVSYPGFFDDLRRLQADGAAG